MMENIAWWLIVDLLNTLSPAFLSLAIYASRLLSSLLSPVKSSSCVRRNRVRVSRVESASVVMADSLGSGMDGEK
jgi:hypothetical protein